MKKNKHILIIIFLFVFVSQPADTRALSNKLAATDTAGKYTVLAPLPCIESAGIECKGGNGAVQKEVDFKTYVQYTINLLIALSAVTAVVMIVWGGIEYMWSASFSERKAGLQRAKNAIYGLLLVLTSYIILRTIDPRFVEIPNTLVPQLKVEEWLTEELTWEKRLQDEIAGYRIKSAEIGVELQKISDLKIKKLGEISAIDKEIEALQTETPDAQEKYNKLILQKTKLEEDLRKINVDFKMKVAESAFNGSLLTANYSPSEFNNLHEEALKTIKEDMKIVDANEKLAREQLEKLGQFDTKKLDELANTTKIQLEIKSIEVVIASAKFIPASGGYGSAKAGGSIIDTAQMIIIEDGSTKTFSPPSEAKKYIMEKLNKVDSSIKQNVADQKNIDLLNNKLKQVNELLEGNKNLK